MVVCTNLEKVNVIYMKFVMTREHSICTPGCSAYRNPDLHHPRLVTACDLGSYATPYCRRHHRRWLNTSLVIHLPALLFPLAHRPRRPHGPQSANILYHSQSVAPSSSPALVSNLLLRDELSEV